MYTYTGGVGVCGQSEARSVLLWFAYLADGQGPTVVWIRMRARGHHSRRNREGVMSCTS